MKTEYWLHEEYNVEMSQGLLQIWFTRKYGKRKPRPWIENRAREARETTTKLNEHRAQEVRAIRMKESGF